MSFYLYHRETSQRPWTMTDEGDGERLDAWTAAQFREQLDLVEALRALGCELERRDG